MLCGSKFMGSPCCLRKAPSEHRLVDEALERLANPQDEEKALEAADAIVRVSKGHCPLSQRCVPGVGLAGVKVGNVDEGQLQTAGVSSTHLEGI